MNIVAATIEPASFEDSTFRGLFECPSDLFRECLEAASIPLSKAHVPKKDFIPLSNDERAALTRIIDQQIEIKDLCLDDRDDKKNPKAVSDLIVKMHRNWSEIAETFPEAIDDDFSVRSYHAVLLDNLPAHLFSRGICMVTDICFAAMTSYPFGARQVGSLRVGVQEISHVMPISLQVMGEEESSVACHQIAVAIDQDGNPLGFHAGEPLLSGLIGRAIGRNIVMPDRLMSRFGGYELPNIKDLNDFLEGGVEVRGQAKAILGSENPMVSALMQLEARIAFRVKDVPIQDLAETEFDALRLHEVGHTLDPDIDHIRQNKELLANINDPGEFLASVVNNGVRSEIEANLFALRNSSLISHMPLILLHKQTQMMGYSLATPLGEDFLRIGKYRLEASWMINSMADIALSDIDFYGLSIPEGLDSEKKTVAAIMQLDRVAADPAKFNAMTDALGERFEANRPTFIKTEVRSGPDLIGGISRAGKGLFEKLGFRFGKR